MGSSSCVCSDTLLPLMRLTSSVNDMMKSEASDQSMANMSNAGHVLPPGGLCASFVKVSVTSWLITRDDSKLWELYVACWQDCTMTS